MGCVYKAQDTHLNNVVALKKMFGSGSESDDSEYLKQKFTEEAALLSQLHHGGLPKVIDFFSAADPETGNDAHYLVMTFIEGEDLETIISERGGAGFPLSEVMGYFRQILTILHYLHSRNPPVIYRDLKPSNIMISKGKLFLVDFGIARIFQPSQKGTAIGTPGYAAPEQFTGYAEPRSDIYSLGAVIHYLVTSVNPEDPTHQLFHFQNPRSLKPEVPGKIASLLMSMVEAAPEKRPPSAEKIMEMLDSFEKKEFSMQKLFKKAGLVLVLLSLCIAFFMAMRSSLQNLDKSAEYQQPVVNMTGEIPSPSPTETMAAPAAEKSPDITDSQSISRDILESPVKARQALAERYLDYTEKTFFECIDTDDLPAVQLFLASGMNPNIRGEYNKTPLHIAARKNRYSSAELLIKNGAKVNTKDSYGVTPLEDALNDYGSETARILINKGADVHLKNKPQPFLVKASELGYTDIVKMLISKKVNVNVKDYRGYTPLCIAAGNGHAEIVKLILAADADVNIGSGHGYTPLYTAAEKGYTEIARILVMKGAKVNARTTEGSTPLCRASERNASELMELLINKGAETNLKSKNESAPLQWATSHGNYKMVKLLLSKGADINIKTNFGGTPLLAAVNSGFTDIAELLISRGADINARESFTGDSPLHKSLFGGRKLTSLLVSKGADVNSRNNGGSTPLHMAAVNGHPEDIKCLLAHGAKVNAKDNRGCTPLNIAIQRRNAEKITLLRNAGGIE